jgi:hypothetical protein
VSLKCDQAQKAMKKKEGLLVNLSTSIFIDEKPDYYQCVDQILKLTGQKVYEKYAQDDSKRCLDKLFLRDAKLSHATYQANKKRT